MKRFLESIGGMIVFFLKILLYMSLFLIFFYTFSEVHWPLKRLNRTMVVTVVTFIIVGILLLIVYGDYDIGKRKSKPIIYSMSLAAGITDIVTWLMLSIMNTNPDYNTKFVLENQDTLFFVIVMQVVVIIIFAYLGNYIYFKIYDPEKCCLITANRDNAGSLFRAIEKFKKQYNIVFVDEYTDSRLYKHIDRVDTVFLHEVPVSERENIVEYCYKNFKNIYYTPDIADIVQINARHSILDDVSLVAAPVKELTLEQRVIKRATDIVISLIAIIISSPIWVICAIAIKVCDKGPVFYRQNRVTKGGKIFTVLKFRTMKVNDDHHSVTADDDRITSVGKFLRKYRIDEIPQFVNILLGDMSVVGPRPEMIENVYNYSAELPEFEYRLRVKAGLTGYAQVEGKYSTSPKDKLMMDLMYIENYSFLKDIKLIMMTAIVLLKKDSTEAFNQHKEIDWKKYKKR